MCKTKLCADKFFCGVKGKNKSYLMCNLQRLKLLNLTLTVLMRWLYKCWRTLNFHLPAVILHSTGIIISMAGLLSQGFFNPRGYFPIVCVFLCNGRNNVFLGHFNVKRCDFYYFQSVMKSRKY